MDADELYGLALDQFVPERGALAKALRGEGRRDDAAHVAGLRKPSVAAWAVNQLVRTHGQAVKELFDAGDTLRDAQENVLAGRSDARALRSASERERAAVEGLVQTARGLLTSDGHELSQAIIERVSDTLHAAALDEDARERVREGRLARELRHVGMGLGEDAGGTAFAPPRTSSAKAAPKPGPSEKRTKPAPAKPAKRDPAARERAAAERAEVKRIEAERAAARKAARVAEAQARRRTERAASAMRAAEERRERASDALTAADDALAAAQEEAGAAADAHRRAQADLESA